MICQVIFGSRGSLREVAGQRQAVGILLTKKSIAFSLKAFFCPCNCDPEGDGYGNWKKDIQVWQVLVGDDKMKQHGAAVSLSLQGTARDAVRSTDASVLNTEHGLGELIRLVDTVYLKDSAT